MGSIRTPARVAAAAALFSLAAAAAAQGDGSIPVYRCHLDARITEVGPGNLRVYKSFREDGAVNEFRVVWESRPGDAVHLPSFEDQAFVTLQWPGEHRLFRDGESWNWAQGSIRINFFAADAATRGRPRHGEEWRQTVVDRNQSANIYDQDDTSILMLPILDFVLAGDLEPVVDSARLNMSLDSLLAWGSGGARVTVYDTLVTRRRPMPNIYPTSPSGAHRIVGNYDLDIPTLTRTVALIRATTERWEEGLSASWRQCERTTEGGAITVGNNRIRQPGSR
jgi:hypothetical protein